MQGSSIFSYVFLIVSLGLIGYFWDRSRRNEPLNPFTKKKKKTYEEEESFEINQSERKRRGKDNEKKKRVNIKEILEIEEIKYRLMRLKKDRFILVIKADAVNYYLKSPQEQEAIDAAFESAISAYDGSEIIIYTQSRKVDYDDHILNQLNMVKNNRNLNEAQQNYCYHVLNVVDVWQSNTDVYDKHRYILLPYDLSSKDKNKFKNEDKLWRRILKIQSSKAKILIDTLARTGVKNIDIATNKEIYEMLHFAMRRSDARKYKLEEALIQESDSLFVTSDRDEFQIELVDKITKEVQAGAR